MNSSFKFIFSFGFSVFLAQISIAQHLASSYHPKNKIEKQVLAKVNDLPEIKEWLKTAKYSKPDILMNDPDSKSKYYSFQVGLNNLDMFRTNYWLYVDPKNLEIYYWDQLNIMDNQMITLEQWRHWRTKPGFQKQHIYKNNKLVTIKDK